MNQYTSEGRPRPMGGAPGWRTTPSADAATHGHGARNQAIAKALFDYGDAQ